MQSRSSRAAVSILSAATASPPVFGRNQTVSIEFEVLLSRAGEEEEPRALNGRLLPARLFQRRGFG